MAEPKGGQDKPFPSAPRIGERERSVYVRMTAYIYVNEDDTPSQLTSSPHPEDAKVRR